MLAQACNNCYWYCPSWNEIYILIFSLEEKQFQVQDFSGRLAIPGTVSPHYRLFFRLPKMLPSIVPLHSSFHWYENSISYLVTAGTSYQTRNFPSQALCCSDGIECNGRERLIVVFCDDQGTLKPPEHRHLERKGDTEELET